ncbi:MAG: ATP synthase F1 subunit delta [Candidatus Omnitrophica bacterium]|jgi:F-type H+-transporting ATPase subunit delta|nr:ATP synthase F1 subunit delta [Candidatus Omnitrophota bacterium]
MIKNEILARRYAEAFLKQAKESSTIEQAVQEFKKLRELLRNNPDILELLRAPQLALGQKHDFIDKIAASYVSKDMCNFLKLLVERFRIGMILDIAEYVRFYYTHPDEVDAVLKTSLPLDLELLTRIKNKLEEKFNSKFKLYLELDGSLMGGIQVVIGNTVIDGSVRRRFEDLKEKLLNVRTDT